MVQDYYLQNRTFDVDRDIECGDEMMVGTNVMPPGRYYVGAARMVAAQWDNQCPSMYLRNRNLVYDQDFGSKHDLIVDPSRPLVHSSGSYEQPIQPRISTPDFIVNAGVNCTMSAPNSVVLKTGFIAKSGSNFKAITNGALCAGSRSGNANSFSGFTYEKETYTNPQPDINNKEGFQSPSVMHVGPTSFDFFPNPSKGLEVTFRLKGYLAEVQVIIYNSLGQPVKCLKVNNGDTRIKLSSLAPGQYFIECLSSDASPSFHKLLVQ